MSLAPEGEVMYQARRVKANQVLCLYMCYTLCLKFIHSFIHSFIQEICIECQLYIRYCSRYLGGTDYKTDQAPVPVNLTFQPFYHLAYIENTCLCFKTQNFRPALDASMII